MTRILLIAPYQGLVKAVEDAASERTDIRLNSFVGDLDEAMEYLNSFFYATQYDVIISRGGTARLISGRTRIPVVEIKVSVLDALRSLKRAENTGQPFVIVGFSNITSAMRTLADVLGTELEIYEINDRGSAQTVLSGLIAQGRHPVVLGDAVTVNIAGQLGMDWLLIDSGRESLMTVLDEAVSMADNIVRSVSSGALFEQLAENSPYGIAVFNEEDRLCYLNHLATGLSTAQITELLRSYLPDVRKTKRFHARKRLKPYRLDINALEYRQDAENYILFYIDISKYFSPRSTQGLISEENADDVRRHETMSVYPPSYLRAILDDADSFFSEGRPLVVYGEAGTGKDHLVESLYLKKFDGRAPLVTVYCPLLDAESWEELVRDARSPLYGRDCMIFFKSIHTLPMSLQLKLDRFIEETGLLSRNTVICTSRLKLADMVANSMFVQSLYAKLEISSVMIPPLKERQDELRGFISHFLGCYSLQYNKHIMGFSDQADELLIANSWQMNIEELRQTVKKLVITCDTHYISQEAVSGVLKALPDTPFDIVPIDLTRTLDEIELDIIKHVLVSENMSHSQAALRLGISRSTLWRKLNSDKK